MDVTIKISKRFCISLFLVLSLFCQAAHATQVAITVDDLPISGPLPVKTSPMQDAQERMQITQEMLAAFKKHGITHVYGFINGVNVPNQEYVDILQTWVKDGQLLGNHTYTHINPNTVSAQTYIRDIQRNDPILEKVMGNKDYKYFRYPFLAEGNTPDKRNAIRNYLASQGYKIAPVTIDWADWMWLPGYVRCVKRNNQQGIAWLEQSYMQQAMSALQRSRAMSEALYHRDIKQIMLIHIGLCDAKMVDRLLTAYEKQGVKFISLPDALSDPAYRDPINFEANKGFTFFYKIQKMKGVKMPKSVTKYYIPFPEAQLNSICKA